MISKIQSGSIDKIKNNTPQNVKKNGDSNIHFNGLGELALRGIQLCEQHPMINVSVLDCTTAIFPRTFFETFIGSKKKDENGQPQKRKLNIFGGFEAFRRESSGLFINCLIPSFVVVAVAKLFNKPVMGGFNKSNLTNSWANSESIDKIQKYYMEAKGSNNAERIYSTLDMMIHDISGADGSKTKVFADVISSDKDGYRTILQDTVKNIVEGVNHSKENQGLWHKFKNIFSSGHDYTENLYNYLVSKTCVAENIKFKGDKGYSTSSLKHMLTSAGDMLHGLVKEGITDNDTLASKYFSKAKRLVNTKSAVGLLGIIIPLALSAQPINRWITHKLSGHEGAPIYNDDKERILTPSEKKKLNIEKCFAVPLMWGVAGLSMLMDRPSLKMFQFKGLFPTMDQARIISAMTFSSRIATSEDSNELQENTIRDIATFCSFYFLGDYAAKGIATFLEKKYPQVRLINRLKDIDPNAGFLEKAWHWAKYTSMKSTDELLAVENKSLKVLGKNLRAVCQLGNLAFSLLALGIFIPLYTRTQTNKKKQMQLEQEALARANVISFTNSLSRSPAFSSFSLGQNQKA